MSGKRLRDDCFALPPGVNWTPVDQALALLRQRLRPVTGTEVVSLEDAAGRILAESAVARRSNPPAANSAIDGYAFAWADTDGDEASLPLAEGRAAAGAPLGRPLPAGHAVRILTGAEVPKGADTVVLQEDAEATESHLRFHRPRKLGANTRKAGEDAREGDVVLTPGTRIGAGALARLASVGIDRVRVHCPLRVGILSTGDELIQPGADPESAGIFDANRPMVVSLAQAQGFEVIDLGASSDDPVTVAAALDRGAAEADAIVTSGGASAGDEDHVSRLLAERGQVTSWRIAVKPGRPLALGFWRDAPVFGLPGNPVAAFTCFLIFARPALTLMAGAGWPEPLAFPVPAAFAKSKKPGRREYLRARLDARGHAEVFRSEGSGLIGGLAWADGFVELPDEALDIAPGDPVRYLPFAGFGRAP